MAMSRNAAQLPMSVTERIGNFEQLDGLADRVSQVVGDVTTQLGRGARNVLHGTWLGHPLHPILTDVPLGAWSVTFLADLLELGSMRSFSKVGDSTVAVGLAGAAAAIVAGWNDWQYTSGSSRRIGLVHGLLNGSVTMAYLASIAARKSGHRGRGIVFSMTGFAISNVSAYLGGALVFSEGIGVDHAKGTSLPPEFKRVMLEADLPDGQVRKAELNGARILLFRRGDQVSAIAESCAHLGGPLSEGELDGDVITCPWHGSRFNVCTGELLDGPSVYPQPSFTARTSEGWVEVRQ
jgi:nitrite reductase/ring-hydroxylating ferredoxin subunit/uncharacterized membrane protein